MLAQIGGATIVHWVVLIIVICAVIGIMLVVLKEFGVTIPGFIVKIFWIVMAAILGIAAIKLIISMW